MAKFTQAQAEACLVVSQETTTASGVFTGVLYRLQDGDGISLAIPLGPDLIAADADAAAQKAAAVAYLMANVEKIPAAGVVDISGQTLAP